ncbi:unnamed protein product [marine sediment metagenome]|uniref:Uncharacterized protein n=1 Tax=marine sediment metagenome TaxID=412755 RepID=X1N8W7_9ZZZZ
MAKYKFNEHWRDRDRAYEELPQALQEALYAEIQQLNRGYARKGIEKAPEGPRS